MYWKVFHLAGGTFGCMAVISGVCGRMNVILQTNFFGMRKGASGHEERKQGYDSQNQVQPAWKSNDGGIIHHRNLAFWGVTGNPDPLQMPLLVGRL